MSQTRLPAARFTALATCFCTRSPAGFVAVDRDLAEPEPPASLRTRQASGPISPTISWRNSFQARLPVNFVNNPSAMTRETPGTDHQTGEYSLNLLHLVPNLRQSESSQNK